MNIKTFPDRELFCKLTDNFNVIPFCREILADDQTPVSVLQKIHRGHQNDSNASLKNSIFLFESVEGGERWARYSFMGVGATKRVKIYKDTVVIEDESTIQEIAHKGQPIEILRSMMNELKLAPIDGLPRFNGGLVGYFTYEMVSFFEDIPNQIKDETLGCFIVPENIIVFDNVKHTLTLITLSFVEKGQDVLKAYSTANAKVENLKQLIQKHQGIENKNNEIKDLQPKTNTCKEDYISSINQVKDHIVNGDVIQTVIAQQFECPAPDDVIALYRAQRYINPSPYLYFMHIDDRKVIGASPETMVRLEDGVATLRPIAGTRPRGETEQQDRKLADELLLDEKERAEHVMLVDLGRNDLGKVAKTGSVHVTDFMFVERYSHVMHLVSNITCYMDENKDAFDLLRATFPAGTLTGAPKVRAMEIISQQENFIRGPYGGCIGYISFTGNMDMAITIRTACIENDKMTITAGAGIVYDSVPEKEYEETINKSKSAQRALEMVNNSKKGKPLCC